MSLGNVISHLTRFSKASEWFSCNFTKSLLLRASSSCYSQGKYNFKNEYGNDNGNTRPKYKPTYFILSQMTTVQQAHPLSPRSSPCFPFQDVPATIKHLFRFTPTLLSLQLSLLRHSGYPTLSWNSFMPSFPLVSPPPLLPLSDDFPCFLPDLLSSQNTSRSASLSPSSILNFEKLRNSDFPCLTWPSV